MRRLTLLAASTLCLASCAETQESVLQGYVEGEFVLLAAPAGGTLETLSVQRGQQVEPGAIVFALESKAETAARMEAAGHVKNAQARLANLRGAKRGSEVEVVSAQAAQARAARELASIQLAQQRKLFAAGFISQAQLDAARTNFERDSARVAELEAQGKLARQSIGRDAEIQAAAADADSARAALAQAEWRLAQRSVAAPAAALVQDTYFSAGEWVPPGRPVVSLLPPGNVRIRFFVPERALGALKPGDGVSVACDGCPGPVSATISFISAQAEYTPPVIYNRDSRGKLVFMVEAKPEIPQAARLRPGQPVDVQLRAPLSR